MLKKNLGRFAPFAGLAAFLMALAAVLWRHGGLYSLGAGDTVMFCVFAALMVWFLFPARKPQ